MNFRRNLNDSLDDDDTGTRIPHLVGIEAGMRTDRGRYAAIELLSYLLATKEPRFSGAAAACRYYENTGNSNRLQRNIPNWRRDLTVLELETVELGARTCSPPQVQNLCLWACSTEG